jgi:hypothetical protein
MGKERKYRYLLLTFKSPQLRRKIGLQLSQVLKAFSEGVFLGPKTP